MATRTDGGISINNHSPKHTLLWNMNKIHDQPGSCPGRQHIRGPKTSPE